jgi:hypothetical protein
MTTRDLKIQGVIILGVALLWVLGYHHFRAHVHVKPIASADCAFQPITKECP